LQLTTHGLVERDLGVRRRDPTTGWRIVVRGVRLGESRSMQTFVIGMHRSGTSAIARVLNLMGFYFGGELVGTGRSEENEKGFWERRDVRTLNDMILFSANCDWDCVSSFDLDALSGDIRESHVTAAADIVLNLDAHRPWFVKEPRFCVLFDVWREVADVPVCIHVHRNPLDVAHSLKNRNKIPVRAGLALWEFYNVRALEASEGIPRLFVSFEEMMRDPIQVVEKLHATLNQHQNYTLRVPTPTELSQYLEDDLVHHRRTLKSLRAVATASQLALFETLENATNDPDHVVAPPLPDACVETLRGYEETVDVQERMARANDRQRQRQTANVEMQFALKSLELRHTQETVREGLAKIRVLERKAERLQRTESDLALTKYRAEGLQRSLDKERRDRSELEQERSILQTANASLESDRAMLERQNAVFQNSIEKAISEVSARGIEVKDTTEQWSRELAKRKERVANLNRLGNALQAEIDGLLTSRRWRLGNALVSLGERLLLRGRSRTVADEVSAAVLLYGAQTELLGELATSRNNTLVDVTRHLPLQTAAVEKVLEIGRNRYAELSQSLIEHTLELRRRSYQTDAAREYVEALVQIVEGLANSRRWRVGSRILSLPRRLLGKPAPATAIETAVALVNEYRLDGRSGSQTLPTIAPTKPEPARPRATKKVPAQERPKRASPPMRKSPAAWRVGVDIVVCVHNALDHVKRCLGSILANTTVNFRLIVVNDGSGPETSRWLRRFAARHSVVQLIETDGPLGYTCAANQGLRASSMGKVVLLNSDTVVPRLWLEGLLDCMAADDTIGMVGPLSNAASWQSVPERFDGGGWAVNDLPAGYNVDEFGELVYRVSAFRFPRVAFLNGFCLMIDRRVIDAIGYLDEESFPRGYGEENDYCLRARDAGFELAIADHCYVYHAKSKSFGDASRDALAKDGREALARKYGPEVIEEGTEALKNSPDLAGIRSRLASLVNDERLATEGVDTPDSGAGEGPKSVLFVLPVRGGSGGANSVVQEAAGMRALGVDARVAVYSRYVGSMLRFYRELLGDSLIAYESPDDLIAKAEPFDVIVATLWSTPRLIKPMAEQWRDKVLAYYVQDYEPWFHPDDAESRTGALASYTLVPDMLLMAKTDWICRTVRERHAVEVCRVSPSLDHAVFRPGPRQPADGTVIVAAMIRPKTPRRAPRRTLRVLRHVAHAAANVRVVLFGADTEDIREHLRRNPSDLELDFDFENHGVVTRDEVAGLLRNADIFIDLSDYQAFGRTGLEAMACGCAVVLPAHGGVYEYALDGENACVVDTTSMETVKDAVVRLVEDGALRERLQRRGVETASSYSIIRASLSELSAFRMAWRLKDLGGKRNEAAFRRGIQPLDDESQTVSVAVIVDLQDGVEPSQGDLPQRVLGPLRHRSLENRLVVHEVRSESELRDAKPDVCIVHNGSLTTDAEADEVASLCREVGAQLVYAADDARAEIAPVLAAKSDRIVVPSASLARSFEKLAGDVRCVPAALDESLWLEHSVLGERTVEDRHRSDVTQVLFIGRESESELVLSAWREVVSHSDRSLALTLIGEFPAAPGEGIEVIPRPGEGHEDFVRALRARNQWDVALLPAGEASVDADLRFLAYAALGVATVGSDRGPHVEFIRDGENALLVTDTLQGWIDGLRRVIDDPTFRRSLADRAVYDLETRHSLNQRASSYYSAYAGDANVDSPA